VSLILYQKGISIVIDPAPLGFIVVFGVHEKVRVLAEVLSPSTFELVDILMFSIGKSPCWVFILFPFYVTYATVQNLSSKYLMLSSANTRDEKGVWKLVRLITTDDRVLLVSEISVKRIFNVSAAETVQVPLIPSDTTVQTGGLLS
jgi:hypothetical protein